MITTSTSHDQQDTMPPIWTHCPSAGPQATPCLHPCPSPCLAFPAHPSPVPTNCCPHNCSLCNTRRCMLGVCHNFVSHPEHLCILCEPPDDDLTRCAPPLLYPRPSNMCIRADNTWSAPPRPQPVPTERCPLPCSICQRRLCQWGFEHIIDELPAHQCGVCPCLQWNQCMRGLLDPSRPWACDKQNKWKWVRW